MKRNFNIERELGWQCWPRGRKPRTIIPPKSVIRLVKKEPDWDESLKVGDTFRVGYYSKQDGPHCVWLVDATGNYDQTWDQKSLLDYFEIVSLSKETDTYGAHRPALGPS
jgi:hypothetical protein